MAPSQLLPVLATPKTQMKCSGGELLVQEVQWSAAYFGRTGHFATDDPYRESQICPHVAGHIHLPRVRARISALFFPVFVRIPYTSPSGSSQPGRTRRTCGVDTILPFASAAGKPARRSALSAPEDVQEAS